MIKDSTENADDGQIINALRNISEVKVTEPGRVLHEKEAKWIGVNDDCSFFFSLGNWENDEAIS